MANYYNGNRYLSETEMKVNALYIRDYLLNEGWTINAICGLLGNAETESTLNPSIWQSLDEGNTSLGYGLVQWTPATKFLEWCNENGLNPSEMDSNLKRLLYEVEHGGQYYSTKEYPMSFENFTKSTKTPYYLACVFLHNYERPKNSNQNETRGSQANAWYTYLTETDAPATASNVIEAYLQFMNDIANNDVHGYSQAERSLYNMNNPTSFDCSSLICTAVQYAFEKYNITPTPKSVGCTNTRDMLNLQLCGFEVMEKNVSTTTNAKRGDIELTPASHTVAYLGNNKIVHASSSYGTTDTEDNNGKEICITNWYSKPWAYRLRFTGKGVSFGNFDPSNDSEYPNNPIKHIKRLSKILLYEG